MLALALLVPSAAPNKLMDDVMAQMNNHLDAQQRGPQAAREASIERAKAQRRQGHDAGMANGGPAPGQMPTADEIKAYQAQLEAMKHAEASIPSMVTFSDDEVRAHLARAARGDEEREVLLESRAWKSEL